jgi:cytochrome c-type biogenesis protein CcmH/NrfG
MPLFQNIKHRRYSYKPVYYDEQKERIEELKRQIGEEETESLTREERIRESFAKNRPRPKEKRGNMKISRLLIYVFILCLLIMIIYNVKFLLF